MLRITHNAGLFSCCMIRLLDILNYFNYYKKLPVSVDSSQQFALYKSSHNQDLTYNFFAHEELLDTITYSSEVKPILTNDCVHFPNFKNINYPDLAPFITKYFSPSSAIKERIVGLESKYKLNYDQTCVIYYRGNDKVLEIDCPTYQDMVDKAIQVKKEHPEIKFLVQTDELEFLRYFMQRFPDSITLTETQPIKKRPINPVYALPHAMKEEHGYNFLAIFYFLSKFKYIITTTCNAAIWLCLFRNNSDGVYQYLKTKGHVGTQLRPENNYWYT